MNRQAVIALVKRLQAAGLVWPGEGTVDEWARQLADADPQAAWDACTEVIATTTKPPVTIAAMRSAIAAQVAARDRVARTVPAHLACEKHPDEYDYDCPHCPRQIGAAHPDVMARVRQLAEQAALEAKSRDAQRVADLKRKADDAARRAAEKLEKQRQLEAYHDTQPPASPGVSSTPKESH